jgi:PAS domain S-box-containing protein
MLEFLTRLFDPSDFPPRWHCGSWTEAHGWLHILSDLGIWAAYFAIPCILVYFVLRRRDIPFPSIFWLFGAFILACGTTHLMEAIIFWQPVYRLAGVIKLATAAVSWATVVALVPIVPKALALRTPEELEREVAARKQAEDDLHRANAELEMRVQERTAELARAHATLRQEREMLRITLVSIGDGVIATDTAGRVTFLNRVAESLTGWRQADAAGVPLAEVFPIINEQSRLPVENPAVRALQEGTVVGLANHTVLIARDGTEHPIEDSAAPIRGENGAVAGVVLVFRDATERRHVEHLQQSYQAILEKQVQVRTAQLQASEERFRLLVDGTTDHAIFMLDPTGKVVSWNPGAERIKQYQASEIVGQHFSRFYPAEDVASGHPERALRVAAMEERFEEEGWRVRKDGTQFWASVVITALRDEAGSLRGFSKVTRDITVRKQAEENARRLLQEEAARRAAEEAARVIERQREQLRVTLTSIGDGVIVTDAESRVTLLNPVAQALTEWNEEAIGRPLEEVFHIINEQTRQPVESPVQRAIRENRIVGLANHTVLIARDGAEQPIDDSAAPIRDHEGAIIGVVLVFRDVTERRRQEQALKEADRRKDEFLAILAHELRNPLAPIRNAIELLQRADGDPVITSQARSMLERQVRQMVRLVDDLLDISRISRGKLQLRRERLPLAAVVQSAVETSRPLIEARAHELTLGLPPEPVVVDGDPTRLAQVISNLLNNAAKYTERGGHIWLSVERQGSRALISVRDTGIGIPAEHLPHIFDMFSQVAPTLERSQGGLGIGLALVRGLVALHGGSIEARSSPGKGSELIVRLPVVEESGQLPPEQTTEGRPAQSQAQLRVLIVDDNRDAVDSLAMMLRMAGHEIQTAHDGVEAVQAAASFRPDVAVLDIGMPKMNGYEAARLIREQPWGQAMVLVALTGWGQEEDRRRATEAGFHYHLTKPVEPADLEKLLASLIQQRADRPSKSRSS